MAALDGPSPARVINRDVWPVHPRPLSRVVDGPAPRLPNAQNPTEWNPRWFAIPAPYLFRGWDALRGAVQSVEQSGIYDASPNPWPNNGVYDEPNAWHGVMELLRLEPHTSAHPGAAIPALAPGPTMYFHAPPVFGLQTTPIPAVGY